MGLDLAISIPLWAVIIIALDTIAVAFVAVQMFPLLSDLRKCVRYFKALGVDETRDVEPFTSSYVEDYLAQPPRGPGYPPAGPSYSRPSSPPPAARPSSPRSQPLNTVVNPQSLISRQTRGLGTRYNYYSADGTKGPFDTLREILIAVGGPEKWIKASYLQWDKLPPDVQVLVRREKIAERQR